MAKRRLFQKGSKEHNRLSEIKKNGTLFNVLGLIPLIWGGLFVVMVLWGFGVSIADENWYLDHPSSFIPLKIDFSNYKKAMEKFVFEGNKAAGIIQIPVFVRNGNTKAPQNHYHK